MNQCSSWVAVSIESPGLHAASFSTVRTFPVPEMMKTSYSQEWMWNGVSVYRR